MFFREYSGADRNVKTQAAPIGSGGSAGDTLPVSLLLEGPGIDHLPNAAIITTPFLPSLPGLPGPVIDFPDPVGPLPLPPLPPLPEPPVPPLPPNIPRGIIGAINTGEVIENSSTTALTTALETASGLMLFDDLDLADVHTVSVTPAADGYLGTLTASVIADPSGAPGGLAQWSFSVDNAALQFLAQGQELTQTYTVTIHDGGGGSDGGGLITITGTNDAPVVTGGGGQRRGDGGAASGDDGGRHIDFGDVDLIDAHVTSVTPAAAAISGTSSPM